MCRHSAKVLTTTVLFANGFNGGSTSRHTKGPYTLLDLREHKDDPHIAIAATRSDGTPCVIARIRNEVSKQSLDAEDFANAVLFAEAPSLITALEESLALNINWLETAEESHLKHLSEYKSVISQAQEAIARARGT
jgi:hypothetical protein